MYLIPARAPGEPGAWAPPRTVARERGGGKEAAAALGSMGSRWGGGAAFGSMGSRWQGEEEGREEPREHG